MDFEVRLDPAMQRRLVRRQLLKNWLAYLATAGFTFLAISQSHRKVGLIEIVGIAGIALAMLTQIISYVAECRSIRNWHQMNGDTPIRYQLDEEMIRAISNLGATELKWTAFRELAVTKEAYLLRHGGTHLTLPIGDVPPKAFSMILEKFRSLRLPIRGV